MTLQDLQKDLQLLANKLDDHIGSNGSLSHLPADIDRSGFMTSEQVLALNSVAKPTVLWEGTATDANTVLTLADLYTNYSLFRITTNNNNKNKSSAYYYPQNGWIGFSSTNIFDGQPNIATVFSIKLFLDKNTAKITVNHTLNVMSTSNVVVTEGSMSINKIEGIK